MKLTGSINEHFVFGGAGRDVIYGGDRADLIVGGGGNDLLTGGDGADRFSFPAAASAGVDTIFDFSGMIPLNGTPGAGDGDTIGLTGATGAFSYIEAAAFDGTGDAQARFAGNGRIQVDLNGNGAFDLSFTLKGMTAANQLTTNDFSIG